MRRRAFLGLSAGTLGAVALTACSSDEGVDDADTTAAPENAPIEERGAPSIEPPSGEPPTELLIEDLVEGDGEEAKPNDTIDVHYSGWAWSNGEQFDSSWERGEPLSFTVGAGQVIQGWDEGLLGMKVGGRRKITIPPQMAYGETGAGDAVGPNETLIFVCDLVAVH